MAECVSRRLKEGAAINQSLSTLARQFPAISRQDSVFLHCAFGCRVISELAKSSKTKKKANPPFRESKLTYILKEHVCPDVLDVCSLVFLSLPLI